MKITPQNTAKSPMHRLRRGGGNCSRQAARRFGGSSRRKTGARFVDGGVWKGDKVEASHRNLYAAGQFTTDGGNAATNIAKWDGGRWSGLGSGFSSGTDGWIVAVAVFGGALYAAGEFSTAGGSPANNIAK